MKIINSAFGQYKNAVGFNFGGEVFCGNNAECDQFINKLLSSELPGGNRWVKKQGAIELIAGNGQTLQRLEFSK